MKEPVYASRWPQLAKWWDTATITNQSEVAAVAKRLVDAKDRYRSVEDKTGVPWWMIAGIHEREASQDWNTQLAQGDPLHKVSTNEPRGMGPFDTWEEGARCRRWGGRNKGGVVSGVFNLESSGVSASDWRPRHDKHYHEA